MASLAAQAVGVAALRGADSPGAALGSAGGLGGRTCGSAASLTSRWTSSFSGSALTASTSCSQLAPIQEGRGPGPRRFSSRHVPSVAEDIAYFELLTPSMHTRFNGLMKYLKNNSAQEDGLRHPVGAGGGCRSSLVSGGAA